MQLKVWCIFCLIGILKGTTTQGPLGCYTQPPGRGKTDRVMSCQDKYAVIPDQLYCQKNIQRHPLSEAEKNEIENKHNEIRRSVSPTAANMLSLKYNEGLGRTAQVWAELCRLQPSQPLQRFRPGSFTAGENVYVSQTNVSWSDVIGAWERESSAFTLSSKTNNQSLVSNYVQLVWAKTSAVGCAKSECGGKFFYVCHYAPGIDDDNLDKPYESSSTPCSQCKHNCTNKLCDCKGIICLNGGELNYGTCLCDCIAEVKTYEPPTCELQCDTGGDDAKCGTTYLKSSCRSDFKTMFHCPWMCDLCPYAGKNYSEGSVPLPWERNRKECPPPTTTHSTAKTTVTSNKQTSMQKQLKTTNAVGGGQTTQARQQGGNGCSYAVVAQWALGLVVLQTVLSIVK